MSDPGPAHRLGRASLSAAAGGEFEVDLNASQLELKVPHVLPDFRRLEVRLDRLSGITLTQPWASLMAFGEKRVETRSWRTGWRGLTLIHAARTLGGLAEMLDEPRTPKESDLAELCGRAPYYELLAKHRSRFPGPMLDVEPRKDGTFGPAPPRARDMARDLPRGHVVAVGLLTQCLDAGGARGMDLGLASHLMRGEELALGNYGPGRHAFVFEKVIAVKPRDAERERSWRLPGFMRGVWTVHSERTVADVREFWRDGVEWAASGGR